MTEHTPMPWTNDGTYVVAKLGPTIADCSTSPSMSLTERRANVALIIKTVNTHDALLTSLQAILDANNEFRSGMPKAWRDGREWEGDLLQDACEAASKVLSSISR